MMGKKGDYLEWVVSVCVLSWCIVANGQSVEISSPLEGIEGQSLVISCSAIPEHPLNLVLKRDGFLFDNDDRLTSSNNVTHKIYTLMPLSEADNGARIQCAIADITSISVYIVVLFAPTIGSFANNGRFTVAEGISSLLVIPVDANPEATNTLHLDDGRTVPSRIMISGNNISFSNVNRNDAGMYNFTSTNRIGSNSVLVTLIVQYSPTFSAIISEEFVCSCQDPSPVVCAARPGMIGQLKCNFASVPQGQLQISSNVSDDSHVVISVDSISITASAGNTGTYTCNATNTILGQTMSAVREIKFHVGDVPAAVEANTAIVHSNHSVTITWTLGDVEGRVPVSNISLIGRPIGSSSIIIDFTFPPNVMQWTLSMDALRPLTLYSVTILANSLLGPSEGRDIIFRTGDDRSGNSNGDGTSVATISLRRITLLFLCSQALLAITEL